MIAQFVKSSDVPARLGLKAAALAWLSTAPAFEICRPGQSRQWRPALAWLWPEPRPGGKIHHKSNILNTWEVHSPATWIECAWVGMFKFYHTLTIFMHTVVWWWCIRPWKPLKRYRNTFMMLNDCQQMKTNINQRDIPCFHIKYMLCADLVTCSCLCTWPMSILNQQAFSRFWDDALSFLPRN